MAYTAQEKALDTMRGKYGLTAFTEDHIEFRKVGYRRRGLTYSANAPTWDEAIAKLDRKVSR